MIAAIARLLARLRADRAGSALIETAVIAPTLIVMSIGGFEVSSMIARQSELQSTAEQATEISLATSPDNAGELNEIEDILEDTAGLSDARVTVKFQYRCATGAMLDAQPACTEEALSTYIWIRMTDEYQPVWTQWGFGEAIEYEVTRTVQLS